MKSKFGGWVGEWKSSFKDCNDKKCFHVTEGSATSVLPDWAIFCQLGYFSKHFVNYFLLGDLFKATLQKQPKNSVKLVFNRFLACSFENFSVLMHFYGTLKLIRCRSLGKSAFKVGLLAFFNWATFFLPIRQHWFF